MRPFQLHAATRLSFLSAVLLAVLTAGCSNVLRSGLMNSNSIMLPPSAERTVYVQMRNTSENQVVKLAEVPNKLLAKGYQLVKDPEQAAYWLQAQVAYCHKAANGVTAETIAKNGFGTGIGSGGTSLPTVLNAGSPDGLTMLVGMAMPDPSMYSSAGRSFGSPSQEGGVSYVCVADVRVTDRGKGLLAGSGPPNGGARVYQMRTVGHVLQKKLSIEEAAPILEQKLSTAIAGLF